MKKLTIITVGLLLMSVSAISSDIQDKSKQEGNKNLIIGTSAELEDISKLWAEQYTITSGVSVRVIGISGDVQHMSITSDVESVKSNWSMLIGRNAIVPVVNAGNPFLSQLKTSGVSSNVFKNLLTNPESRNWTTVLNVTTDLPIKIYIQDKKQIVNAISQFTQIDAPILVEVLPVDELLSIIRNDLFAIGFCNLHDVMVPESNTLTESITIVPIDKNSNGRLDGFEDIYGDCEQLTHGVWLGKYPRMLSESIYVVAPEKPIAVEQTEFLNWLLAEGNQYLKKSGYIDLTGYQLQASRDKLHPVTTPVPSTDENPLSMNWFFILLTVVAVGLISVLIYAIVRMFREEKVLQVENLHYSGKLNEAKIKAPEGLYYGKSHTWSYMEKDGTVKIGIDDFLQRVTGKLTSIRMKESGEAIRKGEKMMTIIKDGKQLDLYAPVSGIVKEPNHTLINNPSLININPYSEGWVYNIIPKNWTREIEFMLFGNSYKDWLSDEFNRLKDFLSGSVKNNSGAYQHIVLQDGGEIADHVLADLDPHVWEDFQTKFLDYNK